MLRKGEWLIQAHAAGKQQFQNPSQALDLILKEGENILKFMTSKQELDSLVVMEEEVNTTFGSVQHSPVTCYIFLWFCQVFSPYCLHDND